jgi:hypothetical protein
MRAAGLTPPFERRFILDGGPGPLVAGLIPGGNPAFRDSLVVAIALGPAAGAALLEAGRWIAERAAYQPGPARTLMVALVFSDRSLDNDATAAMTRTLSLPLWDPSAVARVVMVGAGGAGAEGAAAQRDLPFSTVGNDDSLPPRAPAVYAALLEATGGRPISPARNTGAQR